MAGSINLSLSQQFDITNGRLLSGGKLYTYAAATLTPQNVYRDTALTLAHPNPITLSSDGRIPQFYAADGSIRARLTNSAGVVQFDEDNILVVGPSSGTLSGSSVDATTIFATGDVLWVPVSGTRTGWVRANARTIGSATSGATERANADTSALFTYLYNTYTDTQCPVSTGRGASAAADFAVNKTITLLDLRGRGPFGLDDMGNSAASRLSGATFSGSDTATTVAGFLGEAAHTLTVAEQASLTVTGTAAAAPGELVNAGGAGATGTGSGVGFNTYPTTTFTGAASRAVTGTTNGGGGTHNNMPPGCLGTWYLKI